MAKRKPRRRDRARKPKDVQQWLRAVLTDDSLPLEAKVVAAAMAANARQQPDGAWTVVVDDG